MELNRESPLFEMELDVCLQPLHCEPKNTPLIFRILDGSRAPIAEGRSGSSGAASSHQEKIMHVEVIGHV